MTYYLMNALPNSVLASLPLGEQATVRSFTAEKVSEFLSKHVWVSAVGHESTAALYSQVLGVSIPGGGPYYRINVSPKKGDVIIAGLFTSPRRLAEGERYTEEEILAMPINWIVVNF